MSQIEIESDFRELKSNVWVHPRIVYGLEWDKRKKKHFQNYLNKIYGDKKRKHNTNPYQIPAVK